MYFKKIFKLSELFTINIELKPGMKVFLFGDLGAGKTTLVSNILKKNFKIDKVQSPTYIHYKKYLENIYHFDLYRLSTYDEFVNIGGEEIFDSKDSICLVEWPELLDGFYKPDIIIRILKTNDENSRLIEITS